MHDIPLWNTREERDTVERFADLYSILRTTDVLERAYIRDAMHADEYDRECSKLIQQFRVLYGTIKDKAPDLSEFARRHGLQCELGVSRLQKGMTALMEHAAPSGQAPGTQAAMGGLLGVVFDLSNQLVTLKDAIELDMVQVVTLRPSLEIVYQGLNKLTGLPPDFAGRDRVREWISKLNMMAPSDRISELDKDRLKMDIDSIGISVRGMLQ